MKIANCKFCGGGFDADKRKHIMGKPNMGFCSARCQTEWHLREWRKQHEEEAEQDRPL